MKIHTAVLDLLHIDGEDGLIEIVYWELHREANTSKNYVIIPLECNKCKSLINVLAEIKKFTVPNEMHIHILQLLHQHNMPS